MVVEYEKIAINKIKNKKIKTFLLAILAGLFISFASLSSAVVSYSVSSNSLAKLLSGLIFPIGLSLVVLLKTELFTGNSLLVIPFVNKKITLKELLTNWLIVYLGNFIGSFIFAFLIYYSSSLNSDLSIYLINIANNKCNLSFISSLILGIFCNVLVCTAIFLSSNATTIKEKITVIFLPILLFIVMSFEHSVANMFYLSIGKFLDSNLTILNNLIPVTLGNIIGGVIIGLLFNYLYSLEKGK